MLGLHHTKKGGAGNPLEALSGSNGLRACADTALVLDSDQNGKTLYVRGRDAEEKETALIFAGGSWTILGEAADVRRSDERIQIVAALTDHGEPMTPAELSTATGKASLNVRQLLFKMAKAGEVHKVGGRRYWLDPIKPANTDNGDNEGPQVLEKIGADEEPISEPITGTDNAASRRHKCDHCRERGKTLEVQHGGYSRTAALAAWPWMLARFRSFKTCL